MSGRPIAICCCYAPDDEPWYRELKAHLGLLLRQGRISLWHQGDIPPGDERATAVHDALAKAQVILLLVSANFFDCDECYTSQLPQAMTRHRSRTAQVIPILLKPLADWQSAEFGLLQVLPRNEQPISTWSNYDAAWQEVVKEIISALEQPAQSSIGEAGPPQESSLPPVWMVPYTRNPVFTGREEALARLTQQLQACQTTALSQSQAISGLGGIGKTQLAVEYAYRHASAYQAVLWARAESCDTLLASFVELAGALGLPQQDAQEPQIVVNAVKAWLHTHSQWLLILDNADDLTVLPPFLPPAHRGHLLLTTREHTMRRLAQRIELDTLSPEVGALFLLRRAGRLAPDVPLKQASPREQDLAQQISRELGGLPLALDQAGAYLEDTSCGLASFLPIYQQRRTELLNDRRTLLNDHPDSMATTVSLAVQRVEQRQPAAAELLRLCAFFAPDAIPEEIFTQGAPHLGPTLGPVAADPFHLNQALSALLPASLVSRDPEQTTHSLHRLVQAVLRDTMSPQETRQRAERAVRATNAAFPDVEFDTWPACKRCLPHTLACFLLIEQGMVTLPEAADLLTRLGWYLGDRGQYESAEAPLHRAVQIREHLPDQDHLATAYSLTTLAGLHKSQGKYAEAEPLLQRALTIREEQLGPQHPDTAQSLNNLATLYDDQGKYAEAEPLYRRALAIREEQLGPQHPNTATSLNNLATLYEKQGRDGEAEPLYRRALDIFEQQLGLRHPNTLGVRGNYVRFLRGLGRDEEAARVEARGAGV